MYIVINDEEGKITPEMLSLMEQAADIALATEFGEEAEAEGVDLSATEAELSVTIVNDEEIRGLNRDYRGIDKVTDVLSFPQFESRGELFEELSSDNSDPHNYIATGFDEHNDGPDVYDEEEIDISISSEKLVTLVGDVVICCDQAARQAEEYGTGITREMLYLFVHSIMHLFGYDHMEEGEKREMRAREEEVLTIMGISR